MKDKWSLIWMHSSTSQLHQLLSTLGYTCTCVHTLLTLSVQIWNKMWYIPDNNLISPSLIVAGVWKIERSKLLISQFNSFIFILFSFIQFIYYFLCKHTCTYLLLYMYMYIACTSTLLPASFMTSFSISLKGKKSPPLVFSWPIRVRETFQADRMACMTLS